MIGSRLRARTNKSTREAAGDKRSRLIGGVVSLLLAAVEPEIYKFSTTQGFAWSAALATFWGVTWACILPIYLASTVKRNSFFWAALPIFLCGFPLGMHNRFNLASAVLTTEVLLLPAGMMWCIGKALRHTARRSVIFPQPAIAAVEAHEDAGVWPPTPRGRR